MNGSIAFTLVHAGHRIEARLEEALAGVELSGANVPSAVRLGDPRPAD